MKIGLSDRLPNLTVPQVQVIEKLIERYDLQLDINNFTSKGLVFTDLSKNTVAVSFGNKRQDMIHSKPIEARILISAISEPPVIVGWIDTEKVQDIGDRFLFPAKALSPMPEEFRFAQVCPHLSVFGGWMDSDMEHWECMHCKQSVVYSA